MLLVVGTVNVAIAQLQLVPDATTQCVFAGDARKINVTWQNAGEQMVTVKIQARIFQASSATAILWSDFDWKTLQVLPGQTVMESAQLSFPPVTAPTRFMVQWLATTDKTILGVTTVWVYPTNQLAELKLLATGAARSMDNGSVGVYDPENELKPVLESSDVAFDDLENSGLENFSGRLAIITGPSNQASLPGSFSQRIKLLTQKNVAVVWIQSPSKSTPFGVVEKPTPDFYSVPQGTNAVVVVQPGLVVDLPENPQAQRNLVYFCQLALRPKSPGLPDLMIQP